MSDKAYTPVVPRDLFNESKLLKCLGQLVLAIHDRIDCRRNPVSAGLTFEHDGEPFVVFQDDDDGELCVKNIQFKLDEFPIYFATRYNSKDPYPMVFYAAFAPDSNDVFNEDGSLSQDFLQYINKESE